MHFTKTLLAASALFFTTSVIAAPAPAPAAEPEALEKRDLLSGINSAAGTLNTAAGGATSSLTAGLNQIANGVNAVVALTLTTQINANLLAIAAGVNTAANGVAAAVNGAATTLTADEIAALQRSIGSIQGAAARILAALQTASASTINQTAAEAAFIRAQTQAIVNSLNRIGTSLQTYLGGVTVTGNTAGTDILGAVTSTVASIVNNVVGLLGL